MAPLLAGFPRGTVATSNPLLALATLETEANQKEHSGSFRLDQRFSNSQMSYLRVLYSNGDLNTPDRTVTPRRVRAKQQPLNVVLNHQSIAGGHLINELKLGFNRPQYSAVAFADSPGYDPTQVSLSGTVNSQSIDARGSTGIARSGLLVRATSNASTNGQLYNPRSISLSDALTWTRGAHTFKFGGEYRNIESQFRFLGSTEITYNGINEFIDNRPAQVALNLESPTFTPQQYYLIGFAQDSWRPTSRLSLELGLRYDFYSVVKEKDGQARPFFVEDNAFGPDGGAFYNPDKNNFAPRLSAVYQWNDKTAIRTGFGIFYGPGQFEDRIQPIENFIDRRRVQAADIPSNGLAFPVDPGELPQPALGSRLHARAAGRVQHAVRREPLARAAGRNQRDGRDTPAARGATCSSAASRIRWTSTRGSGRCRASARSTTRRSGCLDGLAINGNAISGCGKASYNALQLSATRRFRSGLTGGLQYQYSRNEGTTQGSNEAATTQNTFDYNTEFGTNPQDIPHTFNGSLVYQLPFGGALAGGWRVGAIVNARSGVPINVTINRPDNKTINGVTVTNIPGGNSRGTQRPDVVAGVNPYLKDGVRWLNPAAFTTPQPGTFGNLERNALRGPGFWQVDFMASKDFRFGSNQGIQIRAEVFNILNHLNYENPAAVLPDGTAGAPFTDAQAGTFGYMLGPLNRTVGLGTARQTQISLRYLF